MIAYLYRWRVAPEHEAAFIAAWRDVTVALRGRGGLGSRLHRADDGTLVAYARWPSEEARAAASAEPVAPEAREIMRAAIVERFPETKLTMIADLL
jgi:hypothetical protein